MKYRIVTSDLDCAASLHRTVSVALPLISPELLPTITVKLPGSTTYFIRVFHNPRSWILIGISTVLAFPAGITTLAKPLSD